MERKELGSFGENLALKFLKERKYKVLCVNYRCRYGEIDIVTMERDTLVFVEVKTRSSEKYGKGMEAVDYRKQKKIRRIAVNYLSENAIAFSGIRFDVMDITVRGDTPLQIDHIENAF